MDSYNAEHTRVASILSAQNTRLDNRQAEGLIKTKWAREAIHSITIDLAVMYRENDPEFDFPRFLRESKGLA